MFFSLLLIFWALLSPIAELSTRTDCYANIYNKCENYNYWIWYTMAFSPLIAGITGIIAARKPSICMYVPN